MKNVKATALFTGLFVAALVFSSMMLPASKILLRLNPKEGDVYKSTMIAEIKMKTVAAGQSNVIDMNTEIETKSVIKSNEKKAIEIDFMMEAMKNNMNMPGMGEIAYDSKLKEQEGPMAQQLGALYDMMLNKNITMTVSDQGKMLKEPNYSEVFAGIPAEQYQQMDQNMQNSFIPFPDQELKIGDSWVEEAEADQSLPFTITTTYTLSEIKSKGIKIDLVGKIKSSDPSQKLEGSYSGYWMLDKNSCWITSGETRLKINMEVKEAGQTGSVEMEMNAFIK